MFRVILLVVLFQTADFQMINNIQLLKQSYYNNLNISVSLDKEDKTLRNIWMVDLQVKRVNVSTKYRVQMTRHKEHSFRRTDYNAKWTECVFLHRRPIRKSEKEYYADESECLTTSTSEDADRTKTIEQVEKEIRKWRKGFRYLVNTCNADNPDDKDGADACLVQYMEKDNYNTVIRRLITLKLETMAQLYLQLISSLTDLEECLKTQLSAYLEKVRKIKDTLNKCYSLTTTSESETE